MKTVDESNVREFVKNSPYSLVMVGASWCGPCKTMKPKMSFLEQDYDQVSFAYLDIDEGQNWAKIHNIMAVPTFVLYIDGSYVRSMPTSNEMGVRELLNLTKKSNKLGE